MDIKKQRERNEKKNERRLLKRRKRYKKKFLKELKKKYIDSAEMITIFEASNNPYNLSELTDIAKDFLDSNCIIYRMSPSTDSITEFNDYISSVRFIFDKELIKELDDMLK